LIEPIYLIANFIFELTQDNRVASSRRKNRMRKVEKLGFVRLVSLASCDNAGEHDYTLYAPVQEWPNHLIQRSTYKKA
jgi:hypothetical protein